jgi:hypothetical protein
VALRFVQTLGVALADPTANAQDPGQYRAIRNGAAGLVGEGLSVSRVRQSLGPRRTRRAAAFTEGGGAARTDATSGSRSERGKRRSNVSLRVEVALRRGGNRPLAELAADLVDGDERVGALVRVDSNDLTMGPTSLISVLGVVRPAGELAVLEVDQGPIKSPRSVLRAG